jgi:hypothetical protein
MMKRIGVVTLLLLVAGCQMASVKGNIDSPYYPPPVGSKLILNKDITIPPDNAGVMLQGGLVMNQRSINQYQPNCRLEVNAVLPTPQTVLADEFQITHVSTNSYMVRSHDGFIKVGMNLAGSMGMYNFTTVMKLSSARQPQVRSLTCQQWGDPSWGVPVSIQQMRTTLGEHMTLVLPASSPDAKP